jgi:hypothetical protein
MRPSSTPWDTPRLTPLHPHPSAIQDYEAPGLASTVSNLLRSFPPSVFMSLPNDLFSNFIYGLTHLTCYFGSQAAAEETANKVSYESNWLGLRRPTLGHLTDIVF